MTLTQTENNNLNRAETATGEDVDLLELTIRFRDLDPIDLACEESNPILKTLFQALMSNSQAGDTRQETLIYLELGTDEDNPGVMYFPSSQLLAIETNRPAGNEVLAGISAEQSIDRSANVRTSPFDDSWKHWIWSNVYRGCSKEELFGILIEKGFSADDIQHELGVVPGAIQAQPTDEFSDEAPAWDMHDPDPRLERLPTDEIEIYELDDFLTSQECHRLIELMQDSHTRSKVSSETAADGMVDEGRTSSSTFFDAADPFIQSIEQKIADTIGIEKKYGEPTQGQAYQVGQRFNPHHDFFDQNNEGVYQNYCQNGNRTWTFIVYLNDTDLEGGETQFPEINLTIKPSIGKAVCWRSMNSSGTFNRATLHAGLPPTQGTKYIITKWFREEPWVPAPQPEKNTYSTVVDLPYLDRNGVGFEKRKLPEHIWKMVQEAYEQLKPELKEEQWDGLAEIIHNNEDTIPSDLMTFDLIPENRDRIHKVIQPIVQEWVGNNNPIIPTDLYGIRSYRRGAVLDMHSDHLNTHHVGCVVMVDKQVDEDWALHCVDHKGETHKVYLEPGEFVLYECAKTVHGRPEPLVGDWYRNFFVHYRLENWEYEPGGMASTE